MIDGKGTLTLPNLVRSGWYSDATSKRESGILDHPSLPETHSSHNLEGLVTSPLNRHAMPIMAIGIGEEALVVLPLLISAELISALWGFWRTMTIKDLKKDEERRRCYGFLVWK